MGIQDMDPDVARSELERLRKYGNTTTAGDFLGHWLATAMTGKRTHIYTDAQGTEYPPGEGPSWDDIKDPAKLPLRTRMETNSVDNPLFVCVQDIRFMWDQWSVCVIRCSHGTYRGTADFLNLTESLTRAIIIFNEADHPEPNFDELEEDGYGG